MELILKVLSQVSHVTKDQYRRLHFFTKGRTSGVNFINVKLTNFLYKLRFSSYVLALSKNLYEKFARLTLMKLTAGLISFYKGMLILWTRRQIDNSYCDRLVFFNENTIFETKCSTVQNPLCTQMVL